MDVRGKTAMLRDVAREAGVSSALASMVINKAPGKNMRVSEATASRIRAVARRLNYVPNAAAKSLVTKRTHCLGYVMSSAFVKPWRNEYFSSYLTGVVEQCQASGYGLMIGTCDLSDAAKFAMPEKLAQKTVDGLIVIGGIAPELWEIYSSYNLPTVLLDYTPESESPPYAYVDMLHRWEFTAFDYAMSMGHREIGFCLSAYSRNYRAIYDSFLRKGEAIERDSGCRLHLFAPPGGQACWEPELAGDLFELWRAMGEEHRPTIMIGNINLLPFLKNFILPNGIKIPNELSVVIGPEVAVCEYFTPPITTYELDLEGQGRAAVRILTEHLDKDAPLKSMVMGSPNYARLIERGSVRRISTTRRAI